MSPARQGAADWPAAIIFDLDGTLVDSAPDIAEAVNAGFGPLGCPPFAIADVKGMIGGGASVAIAKAAAQAGIDLDQETERAVLERFMQAYATASARGQGLYPGVEETLQTLRAEGRRLTLCTNKAESITGITMAALGIAPQFDRVIAAREDVPKKPHPAMLLRAIETFAVPSDAVMVGDSHADVAGARAAGCPVVVVSYGYSNTPATKLGADFVIDRMHDLPQALATLRAAR